MEARRFQIFLKTSRGPNSKNLPTLDLGLKLMSFPLFVMMIRCFSFFGSAANFVSISRNQNLHLKDNFFINKFCYDDQKKFDISHTLNVIFICWKLQEVILPNSLNFFLILIIFKPQQSTQPEGQMCAYKSF